MLEAPGDAAPRSSDFSARSPFYHVLEAAGARFRAVADTLVTMDCGASPKEEARHARLLAWADFSPLPRLGYKGWNALSWLRERGLETGLENFSARRSQDGLLVVRMGEEALLLGTSPRAVSSCRRCAMDWEKDPPAGVFPVPRASLSAWLRVTGDQAPALFAKMCALDLRLQHFHELQVAQTSLARMNVILLREDCAPGDEAALVPAYHLVFDSVAAEYIWECVRDAALEFGGAPIGCDALLGTGTWDTDALTTE